MHSNGSSCIYYEGRKGREGRIDERMIEGKMGVVIVITKLEIEMMDPTRPYYYY